MTETEITMFHNVADTIAGAPRRHATYIVATYIAGAAR